jgi:hypothetical protein
VREKRRTRATKQSLTKRNMLRSYNRDGGSYIIDFIIGQNSGERQSITYGPRRSNSTGSTRTEFLVGRGTR